jgi:hypothetical protein
MKTMLATTSILLFAILQISAQQKNARDIWIFASDSSNASFITQKATLANTAELKQRDIQVHQVVGLKKNESLFKKYKASAAKFTFILFGKDGTEKLRSNDPVSLENLYRTIDAMPMRQAEIKNNR